MKVFLDFIINFSREVPEVLAAWWCQLVLDQYLTELLFPSLTSIGWIFEVFPRYGLVSVLCRSYLAPLSSLSCSFSCLPKHFRFVINKCCFENVLNLHTLYNQTTTCHRQTLRFPILVKDVFLKNESVFFFKLLCFLIIISYFSNFKNFLLFSLKTSQISWRDIFKK